MLSDHSEIDLRLSVDANVVTAVGEIDMDSAGVLRGALIDAVGTDHDGVVVDMSQITFIDSTGLRELLDFRQKGHPVTITNPSGPVLRLLHLTATAPLFGVE
ncbi:hypothetical protein BH10ACT3_BH10ACT3_22890 [soil metagenome]